MEKLLVHIANSSPDAAAVIEDNDQTSFRQLISRADALADALHKREFSLGEPVCIYLPSGLYQITAQVAVIRAGGSCVPIEPATPPLRVKSMLDDINAKYVITTRELAHKVSDFVVTPIEDIFEQDLSMNQTAHIPVRSGCPGSHRTHILFTSGSTGKPKPIQVLGHGILHVLKYFPGPALGPSDRMSGFINPGFDLSLLEMWVALLSGASVVIIPKVIMTDPLAVKGFLDKNDVTSMMVPCALFNVIANISPTTFHGRRHVFVAGEAVNASAMRKVLTHNPPENLWNAYGPTETTIYVTLCRLDLNECQNSHISIGRPFGNTHVYILDDERKPITDLQKPGEICISGPQLTAGYLNRPKETNEQFLYLDSATLGEEPGDSIRLYRTGDMGQWRNSSGLLDYIGRADKQIKRFGHRVELGDIERTMETYPQVHSCVVNHYKQETSDILAAFLVPTKSDTFELEKGELIKWTKEQLPPYMIPDLIQCLDEFPLSPNGKVDRKALVPEQRKSFGCQESTTEKKAETGDQNNWLKSTLQEYLNVPHINGNDDFFSLGLSSIQAAQLIGEVKKHQGVTISMAELHAHPSMDSLSALFKAPRSDTNNLDLRLRWEQDSQLADDIASPPHWLADDEGRVFLTGATGFLGVYLLHYLLSMPGVKQVACLARSNGNMTASDRIQEALEKYELWHGKLEQMQKIIVIEGELADDHLGMGKDKFHWLANWASVVFHVGARVNWCEPYEAHYKPNVIGTRNVIRLTAQGRRKALHYVSSIDTWNVSGYINKVERVFEDEPLKPYMSSLPYDLGYSQSQWVVDEMVQRARGRGLPVMIYRPGFIIGDRSRGYGNPNDFFGRLIMGCIDCGYFPYLAHQRLEWTPVDYVCEALLHIASNSANLGRSYHLLSTDPTQSVSMEQTCKIINDAGYPVKQIPYHDWVEKIRQSPGNLLEPMVPMLQETVLGDLSRVQTGQYNPVYDPHNTVQALLDRPDIKYEGLDAPLLRRFVDFWVGRGDFSLKPQCN